MIFFFFFVLLPEASALGILLFTGPGILLRRHTLASTT